MCVLSRRSIQMQIAMAISICAYVYQYLRVVFAIAGSNQEIWFGEFYFLRSASDSSENVIVSPGKPQLLEKWVIEFAHLSVVKSPSEIPDL